VFEHGLESPVGCYYSDYSDLSVIVGLDEGQTLGKWCGALFE